MPKTIRNVYYKYLTFDKLMDAHKKSQTGKTTRKNIVRFNLKQEEYIMWLYERLMTKTYKQWRLYIILCNRAEAKKSRSFGLY